MSGEDIYGASGFVHDNVLVNITSRPYDERLTYTNEYDVQPLEFITVTGASTDGPGKNVSKIVRSQAMRNYVWRQNHPALTDEMTAAAAVPLKENPRRIYEGKFRVGLRPRKQKQSGKAKRSTGELTKALETEEDQELANEALLRYGYWSIRQSLMPDKNLLMREGSNSDPFNAFQFPLGPEGQKFIFYYQKYYAVNCIALNLTSDCWYYVREELALFHAVLYLVSLDHNMKYGLIDSPGSLYHGREAFRLINEGIQQGVIRDTLIAAVSMIVTRENLAGKFDQARIHMKGLQLMVKQRGGIQDVIGIHRRVITWADLCYSHIWDCKPGFSLQPSNTKRSYTESPKSMAKKSLSLERAFGTGSPIRPIIQSLRRLSAAFSPEYHVPLDRTEISGQIYSTECDLLTLQTKFAQVLDTAQYISSSFVLINMAAYIYLYLFLRELPIKSQLFYKLAQRLRDALEMQNGEWWTNNPERQHWLLWVIFMGYAAASEWNEKWWFVERMEPLGVALTIWTKDGLESALRRILWQDSCVEISEKLWKDISHRNEAELGSL